MVVVVVVVQQNSIINFLDIRCFHLKSDPVFHYTGTIDWVVVEDGV